MLRAEPIALWVPGVVVLLFLTSCGGPPTTVEAPVFPAYSTSLGDAKDAPPGTAFVAPIPKSEVVAGQTVFVPVYSHVSISNALRPYPLAIMLCVWNTDSAHPIVVTSLRYFDSAGRLVREDLEQPLRIDPMASADTFVPASDEAGGLGAHFLVEWVATADVTPPLVQAVMLGTGGGQSISFVTEGRALPTVTDTEPAATTPSESP